MHQVLRKGKFCGSAKIRTDVKSIRRKKFQGTHITQAENWRLILRREKKKGSHDGTIPGVKEGEGAMLKARGLSAS